MNEKEGIAPIGVLLLVVLALAIVGGAAYFVYRPAAQPSPLPSGTQGQVPTPPVSTSTTPLVNWITYTNAQYGFELKYPSTWNIQATDEGRGFWINPPNFKIPSSGSFNPYFSFGIVAHSQYGDGDQKPTTRMFGTRTGYIYHDVQNPDRILIYFPEPGVAGAEVMSVYTPPGVDEPNQILSTFKFIQPPTTSGIVITSPDPLERIVLPVTVRGYVQGNGWYVFEGEAGGVMVFDSNGKAVSNAFSLMVISEPYKMPAYFEATIGDKETMSHLETATGSIVFTSTAAKDGEVVNRYSLPISFGSALTP